MQPRVMSKLLLAVAVILLTSFVPILAKAQTPVAAQAPRRLANPPVPNGRRTAATFTTSAIRPSTRSTRTP